MTPFKIGVIAAVVAVAMIIADLAGITWFTIQVTPHFGFPLWILVAIYAALQLTIWRMTKRRLVLTEDEIARWGDKLELATPKIINLFEQGRVVRDIASEVDQSHGIPPDVTLRYIIALGKHGGTSAGDPS